MVSGASTKYNKTVTLAKTVQQQQVFLQLFMVNTIAYLMCQTFFKHLSNKIILERSTKFVHRKGHLFSPLNKSDWISVAAESSAP